MRYFDRIYFLNLTAFVFGNRRLKNELINIELMKYAVQTSFRKTYFSIAFVVNASCIVSAVICMK